MCACTSAELQFEVAGFRVKHKRKTLMQAMYYVVGFGAIRVRRQFELDLFNVDWRNISRIT